MPPVVVSVPVNGFSSKRQIRVTRGSIGSNMRTNLRWKKEPKFASGKSGRLRVGTNVLLSPCAYQSQRWLCQVVVSVALTGGHFFDPSSPQHNAGFLGISKSPEHNQCTP